MKAFGGLDCLADWRETGEAALVDSNITQQGSQKCGGSWGPFATWIYGANQELRFQGPLADSNTEE